jgi:hypothetical protein
VGINSSNHYTTQLLEEKEKEKRRKEKILKEIKESNVQFFLFSTWHMIEPKWGELCL